MDSSSLRFLTAAALRQWKEKEKVKAVKAEEKEEEEDADVWLQAYDSDGDLYY